MTEGFPRACAPDYFASARPRFRDRVPAGVRSLVRRPRGHPDQNAETLVASLVQTSTRERRNDATGR